MSVLLFLYHFRNRQGRKEAQLMAVLGLDNVQETQTLFL
jgi:hypothetical protein